MINFESDETVNIFREECQKILNDFELQLQVFEKTSDVEIIVKLMRDAHSIKGSAGIVGLKQVQKLAHKIEDLLGLLKNKNNPEINKSDILKDIKNILSHIRQLIVSSDASSFSVNEALNELIKKIPVLKNDISAAEYLFSLSSALLEQKEIPSCTTDIFVCIRGIFDKLRRKERIKDNNIINILVGSVKILKKIIYDRNGDCSDELIFLKQRVSVAEQMVGIFDDSCSLKNNSTAVQKQLNSVQKQKIELQNIFTNLQQGSIKTLRIETEKLDKLCENIAELGKISENSQSEFKKFSDIAILFTGKIFEFEKMLANLKLYIETENEQNKDKDKDKDKIIRPEVARAEQNLREMQKLAEQFEIITGEQDKLDYKFFQIYSDVRKTIHNIRNLPLGVILHMFPRMVRDIAETEKKEVEIEITGGETFVDKKILEEIKMPLIHLLRNAVDHGLEYPQEREKLGKSRAGKISVSAKNTKDKVIICVKDDGCGINFDKIKAKALEKKLLGKQEIKSLKKNDFINMIFRPGFSTEDKVTEISGRGIGLDIVYTKISELGGNITINTEKGKGTEIVMELPLGFLPEKKCVQKQSDKSFKILVIDDSKTTKIYFKNILKKAGFDINAFDNGEEALKELTVNNYDLIISDIEMPGMNGDELVMQIRKNKKFRNIPILIISMLPMQKASKLFKNIEIDALLSKSDLDEQNLISTVNQLLKK